MKHLKITFMAIAMLLVTACSVTQTLSIATMSTKASLLSTEIETYAERYQEFSVNQDAFTDLESLQSDFRGAISGSISLLDAAGFYSRAVAIYEILYQEAMDRQSEFTATQLVELRVLNDSLIELNAEFEAFIESADNEELVTNGEMVMDLMSITSSVLKLTAL